MDILASEHSVNAYAWRWRKARSKVGLVAIRIGTTRTVHKQEHGDAE